MLQHDPTFRRSRYHGFGFWCLPYRFLRRIRLRSVRTIRTLREQGHKTIMVNYNPETVIETSSGVIMSMGGQTPNNIALPLHRLNVNILGTSPEMIDGAENRYKFSRMLDRIEHDLASYLNQAVDVSREHPVVITKYIENAKEIEMDAVARNGVMDLSPETVRRIEEATRKIGVPPCQSPDYVGVKVPQFSFSRLSGADPVLGVEMASTGEAASFGRDKYEAYLKALLSTDSVFPAATSCSPLVPTRRSLRCCPRSSSTISITTSSPLLVPLISSRRTVCLSNYLEHLPDHEEEDMKSEYSLTQHLSNNLIDLYINLPSNNRFRRPANYMSKVTVLVTSHRTVVLPGLVNIAAFVPNLVSAGSKDFEAVSKASIAGGFSMIRVMPVGVDSSVTESRDLKIVQQNAQGKSLCDFNISMTGEVGSLFVPFNHLSGNINKVATVTNHFSSWPSSKPLITDAKSTDLASILLLASLHSRGIHVMSVTSKEDISLIALSKEKGLKVTCDVSIYPLPLPRGLPGLQLPAHRRGPEGSPPPESGIAEAIPLLFTAVSEGRLTVEDITARLYDNPKKIFELHDQNPQTWSPFNGKTMRGSVQRVVFQGKTTCLDGEITKDAVKGTDMSTHRIIPTSPVQKPVTPARAESSLDRHVSISGTPARRFRALDSAVPAVGELGPPLYVASSQISPSLADMLSRSPFRGKHILSVNQFSRADLHLLFTVAQEMRLGVQRHGVLDLLKGRVLTTLFYEPSTRTSASFDAAMQRLGGRTIAISTEHSSTQKGESLQDTIRTLGCYGDAVVLRHPDANSTEISAKYSQAFLDLFTIREELGTVTGLTITFTGDLKYGRPVHSLIKLLQFYDVRIQLVSPKALALPEDVRQQIIASGQLVLESEELTPEIVASSDILYSTRVQKERFTDLSEYERLKNTFVIDNALLKYAKSHMVVMHPFPRNAEISEEVDFDQRAAYFRQMRYGLYCRMALLALVLAP
ncbi:hypothetical protein HAV15_012109 [Penicillium sp. str. |nr:hypothetical protein HAV15_012109 [Penicillium sp. str. \